MITDYLKNAFLNIKRNKKNKTLIIIFTLLLFLLFIDTIIIKNFFEYYNYSNNNDINFRTIQVYNPNKSSEEAITELKEIDHISEVIDANYQSTAVQSDLTDNGLDGWIGLLFGTENTAPTSIVGKNIADLNDGELICPYSFYPDSTDALGVDESKFLDPEDVLDREITLTFNDNKTEIVNNEAVETTNTVTKKMKIVGLYDESIFQNGINVCYAKLEDIKEIQDAYSSFYEDNSYSNLLIVIDKKDNISTVANSIQNLNEGYFIGEHTVSYIEPTSASILISITATIAIVLIITIISIFKNYLIKKIKNESYYIGILRSCGYTKNQVLNQEICENTLILFISFIISATIFSVIFLILENKIFKYFKYFGFNFTNNIFLLFFSFLIILLISNYVNYRILKKSINKPISEIIKES